MTEEAYRMPLVESTRNQEVHWYHSILIIATVTWRVRDRWLQTFLQPLKPPGGNCLWVITEMVAVAALYPAT
jgi:hypothetical protein